MNKLTAEEFWKVLLEPLPQIEIFYRLYYNEDGTPVCYTMEDLPGNYIEVDKDTYLVGSHNVRVVNQELIHLPSVIALPKLRPSQSTGTACDPRDVCVVVNKDMPHTKWSLQ